MCKHLHLLFTPFFLILVHCVESGRYFERRKIHSWSCKSRSCCDTVIHCVKPTLQNVDSTVLLWHIMAWLYVKYVYSSCSTTILQNMEDGHFNLNFNSYLTFCQWFRFRHVKTEKKRPYVIFLYSDFWKYVIKRYM